MSLEILMIFSLTTFVLVAVPGPTILTLIAYSVSHGGRSTVPLVAAVVLGDTTAITFSLLGLGTLMAQSALLFQLVKFTGGLYLIYLGIKQLRNGFRMKGSPVEAKKVSMQKLFSDTYIVTALNPKGIIFFVSFLPQFVTPGANTTAQLGILAVTFVSIAAVNAALYSVFACKAARLLSSSRNLRIFNIFGGGLLTSAGVWALTAKRHT